MFDPKIFGGNDGGAIFDSLLAVVVGLHLFIFRGLRSDCDRNAKANEKNADRLSHIEGFLQAATGKFRGLRGRVEEEN